MPTNSLRAPNHFTLPISPWRNGEIEHLGKEVLRVFLSTLSKIQMKPEEWPDLVSLVQSTLNNSPSSQLQNLAPIKIFMAVEHCSPQYVFKQYSSGKSVQPN